MSRGLRAGLRRLPRWAIASATAVVLLVVGSGVVYRLSARQAIRNEVHYLLERAQLAREMEQRLRREVDRIGSDADRDAPADAIFAMLRSCPLYGGRDEEVAAWRAAPRSPDRVDAARRWAKVAAEELSTRAAVDSIAARKVAEGHWNGVDVTQGEVDAYRGGPPHPGPPPQGVREEDGKALPP